MEAIKDESTQRNGFILVGFGNLASKDYPFDKQYEFTAKVPTVTVGIPYRLVSVHVCLFERSLIRLMKLLVSKITERNRLRLRLHMEGTWR